MRCSLLFSNPLVWGTQNGRLVAHKPGIKINCRTGFRAPGILPVEARSGDCQPVQARCWWQPRLYDRVLWLVLFICVHLLVFSTGKAHAQPDGKVVIRLAHTMEGEPLTLQSETYENAAGNRFVLEQFKYYLSNIKFRSTRSGTFYLEPESYHLVSLENGKHIYEINVENVVPGTYNEIEFAIGVDNAKNTSTDRVGALDPANQMAWNWHTGYKFMSVTGKLLIEKEAAPEGLVIHVGFDENYRIVRKTLSQLKLPSLVVEDGKTTVVEITVEAERLFNQPNAIDLAENPVIMAGETAQKLADNYQEMFIIKGIQ